MSACTQASFQSDCYTQFIKISTRPFPHSVVRCQHKAKQWGPWSLQKCNPTLCVRSGWWHTEQITKKLEEVYRRISSRGLRPHSRSLFVRWSASVDGPLSRSITLTHARPPHLESVCENVCVGACVNTWVNCTHGDKGKHWCNAARSLLFHGPAVSVINGADEVSSGAWTWTWHQTSCSQPPVWTQHTVHTSHSHS